MNITWIGAHPNNYGLGRWKPLDMIVDHWMGGTLAGTDSTFQDPNRGASATYGIGKNGDIHQYVSEDNTPFSNGHPDPRLNTNPRCISIEHEGGPGVPISEACYRSSVWLHADISRRRGIPLNRNHVKGHNEVAITGTQCPGDLNINRILAEANKLLQGGSDDMTNEQFVRAAAKALQFTEPYPQEAVDNWVGWLDRGGDPAELLRTFATDSFQFHNDVEALSIYQQARENAGSKYPGGARRFADDRVLGGDTFESVMNRDIKYYVDLERAGGKPASAEDIVNQEVGKKFRILLKEAK